MLRASFVLALCLCGSAANADLITQIRGFNFATPLVADGSFANIDSGFVYFDPFNPTLGVLTQVDIWVDGIVNVGAVLPLAHVCTTGGCTPQPYPLDLTVEHDFGLGSVSNHQVRYVGNATGLPGQINSLTTYTQSTSLTATTDLVGFSAITAGGTLGAPIPGTAAALVPPILSTLSREDFVSEHAIPLFFLRPAHNYDFVGGISLGGPIGGTVTSAGLISVTYTFDAAPVAVPEPGTLGLLGAALAVLAVGRRRRQA